MTEPAFVHSLLTDLREALVFQRELGLVGLEVDDELLRAKAPPAVAPVLSQAKVSSPVAARENITQMLQHGGTSSNAEKSSSQAELYQGRALSGQLGVVREELGECSRCTLSAGRTSIVFGVGSENARLMFVGDAPGRDEDLQGEPFVGKGGQLLTKMIQAMGLTRSDVYISNIVKCRPPRNRAPNVEEVESCEPFLRKQIASIRPEVIVALGKYASQTLLRDDTPITNLRGQWREYEGIALMPTFHPDYLIHDPSKKKPVWMDLQAVMQRLGLKRPG